MSFLKYFAVACAVFAYLYMFYSPSQYYYIGFNSTPRPSGGITTKIPIPDKTKDGVEQITVRFPCKQDLQCEGWLYTPVLPSTEPPKKLPVIIMAHGIGATKDMGIYKYALKFAKNSNSAVLLFDYLYFGGSDGEPRHLIQPMQQVSDYISACKYAASLPNIDSQRIALWGTSYSGGHVIVTAAKISKDPMLLGKNARIKAVVTQMPFIGVIPTESKMAEMKSRGWSNVLLAFCAALESFFRSSIYQFYENFIQSETDAIPMSEYEVYTQLFGFESEKKLALNYWERIGGRNQANAYYAKHLTNELRGNDWRNAFVSRSIFHMLVYKPIKYVEDISADIPVLFVIAEKDVICSGMRTAYAESFIKNSEYFVVDGATHFDMYTSYFDVSVQEPIDFYNKYL